MGTRPRENLGPHARIGSCRGSSSDGSRCNPALAPRVNLLCRKLLSPSGFMTSITTSESEPPTCQAELRASGFTSDIQRTWVTHSELVRYQHQTLLVLETYQQPASHDLEYLHKRELRAYLRRFIRFKSLTDARIYRGDSAVTSPLSPTEASLLAADIIGV
jgi:hypothetical protein